MGRVVHVFLFDIDDDDTERGYPGLLDVIAFHTRTGKWPPIPLEAPPSPPSQKWIRATGTGLRFRSEPSLASRTVLASINPEDGEFLVVAEVPGWYKIEAKGRMGWVSAQFVSVILRT